MCRVASRQLGRTTAVVAEARAFVVDALNRWELEPLAADAELLTSELVTNSVLHARSEVTLSVAVAEGSAEIGVTDTSPDLPRPDWSEDWAAESGRGLRLVDSVAREWGVAHLPQGKQVWFRLDVGSQWPHLSDCPCAGSQLGRVRLDSGRWAVARAGPWDG
jgi:anti-sigma regulatory factor (Ser/Thr protein kinase)